MSLCLSAFSEGYRYRQTDGQHCGGNRAQTLSLPWCVHTLFTEIWKREKVDTFTLQPFNYLSLYLLIKKHQNQFYCRAGFRIQEICLDILVYNNKHSKRKERMCKILTKECAKIRSINYKEYVQCGAVIIQNMCVNITHSETHTLNVMCNVHVVE